MKFQFVSDLHLEFNSDFVITPTAPYLLLAGDICSFEEFQLFHDFLKYYSPKFNMIFHVSGNHEYYNYNNIPMEQIDYKLKSLKRQFNNYHYLNNESVRLDDVLIIGTTLWTYIPPEHTHIIENSMQDYRYIRIGRGVSENRPLTVSDTQEFHYRAIRFIRDCIDTHPNLKKILLTHHKPLWENTRKRILTHAFETDVSELVSSIDVCVSGHTHESMDKTVEGTRFLSNPCGYEGETTGYQPACTFTI